MHRGVGRFCSRDGRCDYDLTCLPSDIAPGKMVCRPPGSSGGAPAPGSPAPPASGPSVGGRRVGARLTGLFARWLDPTTFRYMYFDADGRFYFGIPPWTDGYAFDVSGRQPGGRHEIEGDRLKLIHSDGSETWTLVNRKNGSPMF